MRVYHFTGKSRERISGFSTGDLDASFGHNYQKDRKFEDENVHIHTDSDEYYLGISGKSTLWVSGRILRIGKGDLVKIEVGEPHRLLCAHRTPAELYTIKVPDTVDDKYPVETPIELRELMKKHGIK